MKKKLTTVLAAIVVLSMLAAAPVTAKHPLEGWLVADFNVGFGVEDAPCPTVTWAGNITIDDEAYGMVFIPTAEPTVIMQAFHFVEQWIIYETPLEYDGGVFEECDADDVAMWGYDGGVVSLATLEAHANGTVEFVDPEGPFAGRLMAHGLRWSGLLSDSFLEFEGPWSAR